MKPGFSSLLIQIYHYLLRLYPAEFTAKALGYGRVTPELSVNWHGLSFNWHLSMYLVALAGLGIGWVKGFPRWSLGYLGLALIYSWWLHGLITRGFTLFGYPIDRWEWWGWIALLAVALVATLISRSLSPLVDLAKSIWRDWSRLSFILVLPYLHLHFPWQRGLALQGAFNLAWLSSIVISAVVSGRTDVDWPLLVYWFVFLLLPGILGLAPPEYRSSGLT